jgi:hypothetical protein
MEHFRAKVYQRGSRRFWVLAVVLAALLGTVAFWGTNKQALGLFHDDGIYTVVGKSLYQGEGYRIISLPGAPSQTKYPFLYSYLLSWIWRLDPNFPQNIAAFKALNVIALIAIFFLSLVFYQRQCGVFGIGAIVFSLLVCANPVIFTFTDYVISDLLFVLLALAALTVAASDQETPARMVTVLLLGIVTGLACLTRLAAAPLVFSGSLYCHSRRRWRGLLCFVGIIALFIGPWFLRTAHVPQPAADSLFAYYAKYDFTGAGMSEFGASLRPHWPVISGNARYLVESLEMVYLTPLLPGLNLFVFGLTLIGMIKSLHREELFHWSFFLSSLALLLIWPFHPGRYMAPLVPLLILFLFRGMKAIEIWITSSPWKSRSKNFVAKLAWCPVALILVVIGVWLSAFVLVRNDPSMRGLYGNRVSYGWAGYEESFAWIRGHVPPDALLATAYDPMYYLYTGRRAIRPALHRPATYFYPYGQANPNVGSVDEIRPQLDQIKAKYLIVDPLDGYAERSATSRLFDELLLAYGDKAKNVFTSSDGKHKIYELSTD